MKDGGPAFPLPGCWYIDNGEPKLCSDPVHGLSLRDWFAGMALIGIIRDNGLARPQGSSKMAYEHADAMLVEREKQP